MALCTPSSTHERFVHGVAGFLLLSSFILTVFVTAFVASREKTRHEGPHFIVSARSFTGCGPA